MTMTEFLFLTGGALLFGALLGWGFKYLPRERWQMFAVLPVKKHGEDSWHGANLTYYGFFLATSQLFAVALLLILFGAMHISISGALTATAIVLLVSVPAAKIVAILVEKKHHTFTIGGASFVGIIIAPWALVLSSNIISNFSAPPTLPVVPVLAAMSVCYTLGEGLGRLGCISFGCCYGKPVSQCSSWLQSLFRKMNFCFTGPIKKAVYEGKLSGQELVPIQAVTAVLYTATALAGCFLILHSWYQLALLFSIVVSQGWRIVSEAFRADFRGFSKISAYQKMGLVAIVYIAVVAGFLPHETTSHPQLEAGLRYLWHPGVILGLQIMWLAFFIMFGKSTITMSEVTINLREERI